MNYTRGYKASFYAVLIDPVSWMELDRINVTSGSITNTESGLRQTARLTVRDFDQTQEHWLRIYMDARQDANIDHVALFTGLAEAPSQDIDAPVITNDLECYSVLEPINTPMIFGEYIPYGVNAGTAIKRLLKPTKAPVEIDPNTPIIQDYIIAEENETNLTMIEKILKAVSTDSVGWQMVIDGMGTIRVRPRPTKPALVVSAKGVDIIKSELKVTHDWFKVPNVFKATSGDAVAVAKDENPDSPYSTASRGREIVVTERDVTLAEDEGLAEYAKRRLAEEQQIAEIAEYPRRFMPGVYVGDIVRADYDVLNGDYEVTQQDISFTHNGELQEKVKRISKQVVNALDIEPKKTWSALVMPGDDYLIMPDGKKLVLPVKTISTN